MFARSVCLTVLKHWSLSTPVCALAPLQPSTILLRQSKRSINSWIAITEKSLSFGKSLSTPLSVREIRLSTVFSPSIFQPKCLVARALCSNSPLKEHAPHANKCAANVPREPTHGITRLRAHASSTQTPPAPRPKTLPSFCTPVAPMAFPNPFRLPTAILARTSTNASCGCGSSMRARKLSTLSSPTSTLMD